MPQGLRQGLVTARRLSEDERAEVSALSSACRGHDGPGFPVDLDTAWAMDGRGTDHLLYYEAGALVGFAGVPNDEEPEVIGRVHPGHRRRGIGRALLEAAKAECRRRGQDSFLLVCEGASVPGAAFAGAVGAEYRFSEYRMKLVIPFVERRAAPAPETIRVERADATDVETLV